MAPFRGVLILAFQWHCTALQLRVVHFLRCGVTFGQDSTRTQFCGRLTRGTAYVKDGHRTSTDEIRSSLPGAQPIDRWTWENKLVDSLTSRVFEIQADHTAKELTNALQR